MAKSTRPRDLILGLLFFGGLFGLAFVTATLRDTGMADRHYINVLFDDVYGIKREDSVLVHGTRFGRVNRVVPITNSAWAETGRTIQKEDGSLLQPNVLVVVELDHELALREGYRVYAADSNLLGGKVVRIEPGPTSANEQHLGSQDSSLDHTDPGELGKVSLIGTARPHPINALGRLVEDNLENVNRIVEDLKTGAAGLNDANEQGALGYLLSNPDARASLKNLVERLDDLATQANQPGSLVNDLFYDGPVRQDTVKFIDLAREYLEKANDDSSVLGALAKTDSTLRQNIDDIAANLQQITDQANKPGSLIFEITDDSPDSMGAKADALVNDIQKFIEDGTHNEDSLLYRMAYGDMGKVAQSALNKIDIQVTRFGDSILGPIENEEGLIGLLLKDEETKKKFERLLSATLGIIEDAREAAPVTSLGSFIFGGF